MLTVVSFQSKSTICFLETTGHKEIHKIHDICLHWKLKLHIGKKAFVRIITFYKEINNKSVQSLDEP